MGKWITAGANDPHLASDDYEELTEVLIERPPLEHITTADPYSMPRRQTLGSRQIQVGDRVRHADGQGGEGTVTKITDTPNAQGSGPTARVRWDRGSGEEQRVSAKFLKVIASTLDNGDSGEEDEDGLDPTNDLEPDNGTFGSLRWAQILESEEEVSTLLDKLASGSVGNMDLCDVSVEGSNLFCGENKGIPREQMPQLSNDSIDAGPPFTEHMRQLGYIVESTTINASQLKASQNQLNGQKVAGIRNAIESGSMEITPLFVSQDNYVVDGHHRWAAIVASEFDTGRPISVYIHRVNLDIIPLLEEAKRFAASMGIAQAGVFASLRTAYRNKPRENGDWVLLYHGTTYNAARDIESEGITQGSRIAIYLTDNEKRANYYAFEHAALSDWEDGPEVIQVWVDRGNLSNSGMASDEYLHWEEISPDQIESSWEVDYNDECSPPPSARPADWWSEITALAHKMGSRHIAELDTIPLYSTADPIPGEGLAREYALSPHPEEFAGPEIEVISAEYRAMPILDRKAVALWQQLAQICEEQRAELEADGWEIIVQEEDPYATADEMFADMEQKIYKVTTLHSHHPVWTLDDNVNFRIAHDIHGHGAAGSDFSFFGEVQAYRSHCEVISEYLWPVLFTEIVAQSAYANVHHLFGEQKVGFLDYAPDQIARFVDLITDAPDPSYDALHFSATADWDEYAMRDGATDTSGEIDPDTDELHLTDDAIATLQGSRKVAWETAPKKIWRGMTLPIDLYDDARTHRILNGRASLDDLIALLEEYADYPWGDEAALGQWWFPEEEYCKEFALNSGYTYSPKGTIESEGYETSCDFPILLEGYGNLQPALEDGAYGSDTWAPELMGDKGIRLDAIHYSPDASSWYSVNAYGMHVIAYRKTASVTPDQISDICSTRYFDRLLDDALGSQGCSAIHGGCRVVAEALQQIFGGRIMALVIDRGDDYDYSEPFVNHYVLELNGRYLDGAGWHSQHDLEYNDGYDPCDFRYHRLVEATPAIRDNFGRTIWSTPEAVSRVVAYIENFGKIAFRKKADWAEVQQKAHDIYEIGGVRITGHDSTHVSANVMGDHGVYETEIQFVPGSKAPAMWNCTCPWAAYSWGRSGRWKKYEGRVCVLPETMISMADGSFKRIDEINVGDLVLTHDGIAPVEQVIISEYRGQMQSIKSAGYHLPLDITPNHEVWAYGTPQRLRTSWQDINGQGFKFYDESFLLDDEPRWIDSGELRVHDWLTGPVHPTSQRTYLDVSQILDEAGVEYEVEDGRIYTTHAHGRHQGSMPVHLLPSEALMDILGIYLAEGNFDTKRTEVQWTIHQDEEHSYGKMLQVALDDLGAGTIRIYRRPGVTKGISLRVTNRPLALVMQVLAGEGSRDKALHPWVMTLPSDLQQQMFDAYWMGDGHQSDARRTISTTSDILAQQLHSLLVRCGHLPSWRQCLNSGGPTNRDNRQTINQVAYVPDRRYANGQRANGDGYYAAKISAVDVYEYEGSVYNLKVTGPESYVANGRIVHNCSHTLALLYQYQSESMFGNEVSDEVKSPGWDNEISTYEKNPPKEWRVATVYDLANEDWAYDAVLEKEAIRRTKRARSGDDESLMDNGIGVDGRSEYDVAAAMAQGKISPQQAREEYARIQEPKQAVRKKRPLPDPQVIAVGSLLPLIETEDRQRLFVEGSHYECPICGKKIKGDKQSRREHQFFSHEVYDHHSFGQRDEIPEPALPSTDGLGNDEEDPQDYDEIGDDDETATLQDGTMHASSREWLMSGVSEVSGDDFDIAKAAREHLALKNFTRAEQDELINEGEGVTASNLDKLQIEDTHYAYIEEQLARAEANDEQVLWW